jgi:hypothetical protein
MGVIYGLAAFVNCNKENGGLYCPSGVLRGSAWNLSR